MKKLVLIVTAFLGLSAGSASATCTGPAIMHDFAGTPFNMSLATNAGDGNCASNVGIIGTLPPFASTPTPSAAPESVRVVQRQNVGQGNQRPYAFYLLQPRHLGIHFSGDLLDARVTFRDAFVE